MAQDFLTFGRTQLYYVNDLYNVASGIVDNMQPVNLGGVSDPNDIFTLRVKNSDSTWSYVTLTRSNIRFDDVACMNKLIDDLKDKVKSLNNYHVIINSDNTIFGNLYIYNTNDDIFHKEYVESSIISSNSATFLGTNIDKSGKYKYIMLGNNVIKNTPINDATIYNNKLNEVTIDFDECNDANLPADYNSYQVHITDISSELTGLFGNVEIKIPSDTTSKAQTIYSQVTAEGAFNSDRFIETIYNIDSLTYYKPTEEYELYLNIIIDATNTLLYKYRGLISSFDQSQTLSFEMFDQLVEG